MLHNAPAAHKAGGIVGGIQVADDDAYLCGGGVDKLSAADVNAHMGGRAAAGAGLLFTFFSKTLMNLKHEIRKLMKIRTINTVPIPIRVFIAALSMFSAMVYTATRDMEEISPV